MECHRQTFNAHADEHPLKSTLGNERWMRENEARIKALFPKHFGLPGEFACLHQSMDAIGIRVPVGEMTRTLVYLQKVGVITVDLMGVARANEHSIFDRQETPDDFYRIKT